MSGVWHFLLTITGISNMSSQWYAFWSGFGSDLPVVGGVLVFVHHHNCHTPRCPRMGHPDSAGTVQCRHHRSRS
jgi:hypothetical protein